MRTQAVTVLWSVLGALVAFLVCSTIYGLIRANRAYYRWVHWREIHIAEAAKVAREREQQVERRG